MLLTEHRSKRVYVRRYDQPNGPARKTLLGRLCMVRPACGSCGLTHQGSTRITHAQRLSRLLSVLPSPPIFVPKPCAQTQTLDQSVMAVVHFCPNFPDRMFNCSPWREAEWVLRGMPHHPLRRMHRQTYLEECINPFPFPSFSLCCMPK